MPGWLAGWLHEWMLPMVISFTAMAMVASNVGKQ